MRSILITFFFCINSLLLNAQPFAIGHTTRIFTDPQRNNRQIETEIYYPAIVAGDDTPFDTIAGRTQLIVFGHGFVMTWSAYSNVWNALVAEGFVVAFPKTESGLFPNHEEFAKDLAFLAYIIPLENYIPGSLFYNNIDTMTAVMGHSMGGGASILSYNFNNTIKGIANFAAAETTPSAINSASAIDIPVLMFAGANDCVTPPASHQIPIYNNISSNCKTLITITGASHCQFAEQNFNCSLGEATCSPPPTINRSTQHSITFQYLIPWLKYVLKNDCNAATAFQTLVQQSLGVTALQSCDPCNLSNVAGAEEQNMNIMFNSVTNQLEIFSIYNYTDFIIKIYDLNGKEIYVTDFLSINASETKKIEMKELVTELYIVEISSANNRIGAKKIFKN